MKSLVIAPFLLAVAPLFQQSPPPPRPVPTKEHHQFDFWIGNWDVTTKGARAGSNVITSIQGGFALHEAWTAAGGGTGTSLNFYDRASAKWHQVWIDAGGNALFLSGGLEDGKMVLRSADSGDSRQRVTWTPNADGSVRQFWESTTDGGKTWTVAFDGHYVKKK